MYEKQKIEEKTKAKPVEKKVEQKPINYWEGAPTYSYAYNMADNNFCLFDLDINSFNYEQLEHYQYYLTKKSEEVPL